MKRKVCIIVVIILLITILPGFWSGLTVRYYQYKSDKLSSNIRIALVTDLHSCYYGKGQKRLINALFAQEPDVVLLGGDIFDDKLPDGNTEAFLAGIADKYPCYYVTGNHEYWAQTDEYLAKMAILEKYHIIRLRGEALPLTVNGNSFILCGVDDPECILQEHAENDAPYETLVEQLTDIKKSIDDDKLAILLSHRPEFFNIYDDMDFEIVLSGHAHGGQWRVPWLLNGLYAPNQGVFPSYAGGVYHNDTTTMIVSRGLARESTPCPRFYNPPELVIIDFMP